MIDTTTVSVYRIENYPYESKNDSTIDQYYQPSYNFLIWFIPLWVSPNVISLCGLFFVLLSVMASVVVTVEYACVLSAICLFVYQICDALDGKQGKKINMYNNPTTELFDHGVDSIVTSLTVYNIVNLLGMSHFLGLMLFFASGLIFYMTTWEHLYTGVMHFRYGAVNPDGSLLLTQLFYLLVAYWPALFVGNIWSHLVIVGCVAKTAIILTHEIAENTMAKGDELYKIISLFPLGLLLLGGLIGIELPNIILMWVIAVLELIWCEITGSYYNNYYNVVFALFIGGVGGIGSVLLNIVLYIYLFGNYCRYICDRLKMDQFWSIV